jgi:uncharacterized membrane protein YedE/YeeE
MNDDGKNSAPYMNPYLAGFFLGLTLLASFLVLGTGLGASGALARFGAALELAVFPSHTLAGGYFGAWGEHPLRYYLVFMVFGVFFGGLVSALSAQRIRFQIEKGAKCRAGLRLLFALCGGVLAGFASRLAGGCTSGQALSGGALLLTGSIVFLISLFAGGFAAALFFRRQWDD